MVSLAHRGRGARDMETVKELKHGQQGKKGGQQDETGDDAAANDKRGGFKKKREP